MTEHELSEQAFWVNIATNLPELLNDPEGVEHLVDRFVAQYLPVLLRATTKEGSDHVWLAFWHYLVAPRTSRKPFGLPHDAADRLIAEFQRVLARREIQGA